MLSPNELEYVPNKITVLYRGLQLDILSDIVRRIAVNREISRAADWEISRLYELGVAKEVIKRTVKRTLGLTADEIDRIYADLLQEDYARYEPVYRQLGKSFIPFRENRQLQLLIGGVKEQTQAEFSNITRSLGFALKNPEGTRSFQPIAKVYQSTLDRAAFGMLSGVYDYNTMLKKAVKELTDSGLRTVDYETGYVSRVEVAARRALMTGFNQVVAKITEDNAEKLGTNHFEVTYHRGARPTHQPWQGRVYTKEQLVTVCGYGEADGLKGANCYHDFYPFFPDVSKRLYTDEELDRMNAAENTPKPYGDRQYTTYEALQRQRRLETSLRKKREKIALLEQGAASEDDILAAKAKYHALSDEYAKFSKAMHLPQQRERISVDGRKGVDVSFGKSIANPEKGGIIESSNEEKSVKGVHYVGKIDLKKYQCVTNHITTDDVIITDERISHIKERHPHDFERYCQFLTESVENPDYIIEANKPKSALVLKAFEKNEKQFKMIVRLVTPEDNSQFKNSIITFMKINSQEWRRLINNKKILYKSELI